MREIKFRGKRIDNNEWVYGGYMKNINGTYITDTDNFHLRKTYKNYLVYDETIGQFTGLCDKNNVEIYEGDLLKYSEDTSEISGIDEVFYNEEYGTFEVAINRKRNDTEVLGFYLSRLGIGTKYEVIGNIYDNKENNNER